jgi:catechol 2,3-dioxygenase-like lactoylglutathione lyase family enzyme
MKINSLRPMLWTEDLTGTIGFYTTVLGFAVGETNDDWGWASLNIDDVNVMLARPNEHTAYEKIGFTGSFYFNTR